jgi:hypothetical protein
LKYGRKSIVKRPGIKHVNKSGCDVRFIPDGRAERPVIQNGEWGGDKKNNDRK